jgi:hypothetical protein
MVRATRNKNTWYQARGFHWPATAAFPVIIEDFEGSGSMVLLGVILMILHMTKLWQGGLPMMTSNDARRYRRPAKVRHPRHLSPRDPPQLLQRAISK